MFMKTERSWLAMLLAIIMAVVGTAFAEDQTPKDPLVPEGYSETAQIYAGLSISGGLATCSGQLIPTNTQQCNLVLKLYKLYGSVWVTQLSWSASASDGNVANISRTVSVNHGTYKVVCYGNVAGESTTVTSNIVTW